MPLPRHIREDQERKRVEEHRLANRDTAKATARAVAMCVAWSCAGLVCMGWGLHTTDPELGQIAWKGGMIVGYAGILFTLARWHLKAKDRGD
ncbi:MAG TPA: hypothetical protein VM076_13300 [Gemmatimonadaceae bacterium]|nr:hypothetical protein [Gemmatimonadaceae bacterium]